MLQCSHIYKAVLSQWSEIFRFSFYTLSVTCLQFSIKILCKAGSLSEKILEILICQYLSHGFHYEPVNQFATEFDSVSPFVTNGLSKSHLSTCHWIAFRFVFFNSILLIWYSHFKSSKTNKHFSLIILFIIFLYT